MSPEPQSPPTRSETPEAAARRAASEAGFDDVRIASIADFAASHGERLAEFVALDRHGDMAWMAATLPRRRAPTAMWREARSAVVLAMSYAPERDPLADLAERTRGVIASYAKGRDYHDVVKGRLKQVAGVLQRATGADVKVFVDTAPLMEKPLAAQAGIGWQGRHTNLVSRRHGSWLLLGVVLSAAELVPDPAEIDHCGSCRRCLDICPTAAFPAPNQLDARRCISYLTIEFAGHIDVQFRRAMGNRIFGCDDCLAVCPWNKFAGSAREARLQARPEVDNPPLGELLALDDGAFRARFAGTAIKRTGRDRTVRNALIAAGNSADAALLPAVVHLLGDASPLVRAMAVWALTQLTTASAVQAEYDIRGAAEPDGHVRREWHRGLAIEGGA